MILSLLLLVVSQPLLADELASNIRTLSEDDLPAVVSEAEAWENLSQELSASEEEEAANVLEGQVVDRLIEEAKADLVTVDDQQGLVMAEQAPRAPEKVKTTTLAINTDAPEAVVFVDGILAGNAGDTIEIDPGAATVRVAAPGFKDEVIQLTLKNNEQLVRSVSLTK